MKNGLKVLAGMAVLAALAAPAMAQQDKMTFFVTSVNPGKGADLGGLAGADRYCATLAKAAGAKATKWRAYLSTQPEGNVKAVNARDRIGKGPWINAKGQVVAKNVADLHGPANNLSKATAIDEKGNPIKGRGDQPNQHDILTGSQLDGTAFSAGADMTCKNWTSGDAGVAMVGHHDRMGLDDSAPAKSWNTSHVSRGCSTQALAASGGGGLYYCFAAD
jgi:hypothetical protein